MTPAMDAPPPLATDARGAARTLERLLARITAREPVIRAWTHLGAEAALETARARDREEPRGPLHGAAIGVKDVIDTADMPTAYGSVIYAGHRPAADAACVALLRAAGAIVLGKTATTEFAGWHAGPTVNPRDPRRTPGGSSSGSAAAVAAGMVPAALGTQTGGSVIRPAAFCGVVGFKPSFGLIPRAGVKTLADSLDTVGVLAANVADAARVAGVLAGWAATAPDPFPGPRVGLHPTIHAGRAEPAAIALLREVADRLGRAGARIVPVTAPPAFDALYELQPLIETAESARALAHEWHCHRDALSPSLRASIEAGAATAPEAYREAVARAEACRASDALFADCDVLLTPSALGEAPLGLADTGDNLFNRIWTLLHVPCLTLPASRGANGLPLGVQLVGRRLDDARLLGIARWVEAVLAG
jgi:amidase